MNVFRCLRLATQPTAITTQLRPSLAHTISTRNSLCPSARSISLLTPHRPILSSSSTTSTTSTTTQSTTTAVLPDLVPKTSISAHPALSSLQIRCGPRDTYNPSHLVRKRRHGFLARLKSKKGRKTLMRRIKKGRWNLSH